MNIFDLDSWNEVWQTIHRNRRRSIMTAFGVFWGVFMLVILLGFGIGLGKFFSSGLGDMATNTCFMFADRTSVPYKGMAKGRGWSLNTDDIENIKKLEGTKYVAPIFWGRNANTSYKTTKGSFAIAGYDATYQLLDPKTIRKGRFLNDMDSHDRRKVCVIGTQVEKTLFHDNEDPVGKTIMVNNAYYKVVGVFQRKNNMVNIGSDPENSIYIPSTLYQQLYAMGKIVDAVAVTAKDNVDVKIFEKECHSIVAANHIISPDDDKAIAGFNLGEMFEKMSGLFGGIGLLTWIVGLGTLIAGIIGVSNIMLVVVRERTQEIGIRRALGAQPKVIISQILSESFVLTFIAGIMGLTAAVGVLSVVDSTLGVSMGAERGIPATFQISFGMGLLCAFIVIAGSLLAGIIPANRALTIKAVDALRDE